MAVITLIRLKSFIHRHLERLLHEYVLQKQCWCVTLPVESLSIFVPWYSCATCTFAAQQAYPDLDRLIIEVSWSHTDTSHAVGHLWSRDRPERPPPDNTQRSEGTDNHAPGGIRTRNPSSRTAAGLRLKPRGHQETTLSVSWPAYGVDNLKKRKCKAGNLKN